MDDSINDYILGQNNSSDEIQGIQKGLKVLYPGQAAYVIAVKPVLIVKTKDRIVCGALSNALRL